MLMRRHRGLAGISLCVLSGLVAPAAAQSAEPGGVVDSAPEGGPADNVAAVAGAKSGLGYAAMPGGIHVPSAGLLPKGIFSFAAVGGFGWRTKLLGENHRFGRGIGDLGFAYGVHDVLSVALALDGRVDKHYGLADTLDGTEDGYVGDPRLIVRAAKAFGSLVLGGQAGVWVPGKNAPSVAFGATSFELAALAGITAGPALVSVTGGFRVDNSAESAPDLNQYSSGDRVSLGVSDYHAVLAGARASIPTGKLLIGIEGSMDLFVGADKPGPIIRGGGSVAYNLTPQWSARAFVEAAKVPSAEYDMTTGTVIIVPYEPTFTGGLALHGMFGGGGESTKPAAPVIVVVTAELEGVVVDEAGAPLAGAKVRLKTARHTGEAVSDASGKYRVSRVPIGKTVDGQTSLDDTTGELTIDVPGKKPYTQKFSLKQGDNSAETAKLEPIIPPGELSVLVRSYPGGLPVGGAEVTVQPGDVKAVTDASGTATVKIPAGDYTVTAKAPGLKPQTLPAKIDPDGTTIKNFELRK